MKVARGINHLLEEAAMSVSEVKGNVLRKIGTKEEWFAVIVENLGPEDPALSCLQKGLIAQKQKWGGDWG